ncbi:MAG: tRNA 2-thiouridine(34) synthase MnmA [Lachnospiraceae bacterium]|nr:tRNA 2-thiouridine(34) synthase MnmA [Lachnospiraceae bacterium]
MPNKALIAMSGGVDSSVAAYLMKDKGYDCIGATMKLFQNEDIGLSKEHTCCSIDDVEDARRVATSLDMPFYVLNFSENFKEKVVDKFVSCYENGLTPNPCIECNRHLKFEHLYNKAKELGYEYVVTGHYSRIDYNESTGRYELKKASDPTKDQSYVLYTMTQEQLSHTLFPLGHMTKDQVRELAELKSFINAKKHDSQDICFVPNGKYAEFIESYTKKRYPEGDFVDLEGNVLGRHKGIIRYTIGQRRGLGLSLKQSMYVVKVDPISNTVVLGYNDDLFTTTLCAKDVNLISIPEITGELRCKARPRYNAKEAWATVTRLDEDRIQVVFDEPQRAITKGQAVVLYDKDTVIGGGTIC